MTKNRRTQQRKRRSPNRKQWNAQAMDKIMRKAGRATPAQVSLILSLHKRVDVDDALRCWVDVSRAHRVNPWIGKGSPKRAASALPMGAASSLITRMEKCLSD